MEKNRNFRDRESGRVIGGLILVAVGAALLLRNIGFFLPGWLFSWPVILILVGIYIGFKSNFRNNSSFILLMVGGFFLISKFIPDLSDQPIFWPVVIIALGIGFILRPRRNEVIQEVGEAGENQWAEVPRTSSNFGCNATLTDNNDYLVVDSVFSGVNRSVVSKDFRGGHITSVFGGAKIDLSQADITRAIVVKMDIVFGGAKLVVPPHWAIQNEINGAFHGVDDKRKFNPSAAINPDKVLVLKGSAVFGGIEIISY